jgi:hypothetical protein
MSTIDRYKKPGGFLQLVILIETSGLEKQERFLSLIRSESMAWEREIKKKMLTLDRVLNWSPEHLALIFARIPSAAIAAIMQGTPKDKWELVRSFVPSTDKRRVEELLDSKIGPGEISSCIVRLFTEARALLADGTLKYEKVEASLVIPKDIEQKLESATLADDFESLKTAAVAQAVTEAKSTPSTSGSQNVSNPADDPNELKRKIQILYAENQRLTQENLALKQELSVFKDKIERIKKIA